MCEYCKQKITFWEWLTGNYYRDDDGAIIGHKKCPQVK